MERDFRPNRSFTAPVKVGDEISVKIEAVGEKGDGIAKKDGFVLFVPNTKEGDNVKVRVTRVLRKVGFAEVITEGSAPAEGAEEEAAEEPAEEPKENSEKSDSEDEDSSEDSEEFGEDQEK